MRRCLNCMSEYQEKFEDVCPYCGYVHGGTQNGDVCLRPGSILQGRYIVGTVKKSRDIDLFYIGWDALFDRKVLIQEYFPRYCATRSSKEELSIYDSKRELFAKGLELFCSQSRELIRLYKEPNVITYHACFMENQTAYGVMEYREEQTLEEWLDSHGLSEGEGLELLQEAMRAVEKAHKIGVHHGMIGADTFWVTREGRLILKDFGAWRYVSGEPGIVGYGNAGAKTDVYGLAKLFCRMMTGTEITDGDNLELDLLKQKTNFSKRVVTALKHALSYETGSLYRFSEELGGNLEEEAASSYSKNRSKRRDAKKTLTLPKWIFAAAGAGLAAVVIAAVLIFTGVIDLRLGAEKSQLEYNMVRVPNVVNRTVAEAEKMLKAERLEMSQEKAVYSKEIPADVVSYQEIKENTQVEKGTKVVVWISKGEEMGKIPDVVGKSVEEAKKLLAEAKFYHVETEESQDSGVFQSVLRISEQEGANVPLDKEIILTVCMNEESEQVDESKRVTVPDVSGMDRAAAESAVREAELKINWVEEFSDQPEEAILSQDPKAGEEVNKDSYVNIRISKGSGKIYMKNVKLESEESARKIIEELGLKVGTVTESYSDSVAAGKVISQSIAQDEEAAKGASVDLTISKGKDPAEAAAEEAERQKAEEAKRKQEAAAAEAKRKAAAAEASRQAAEAAAEASRQAEEAKALESAGTDENQQSTEEGSGSGQSEEIPIIETSAPQAVYVQPTKEQTPAPVQTAAPEPQTEPDSKKDAIVAGGNASSGNDGSKEGPDGSGPDPAAAGAPTAPPAPNADNGN